MKQRRSFGMIFSIKGVSLIMLKFLKVGILRSIVI